MDAMKTTLLLLCLFCTIGAFGQAGLACGALNSQPQVFDFPSHPQRATQRPLASAQNLLETSVPIYARGERPLWDFAKALEPIPLGDAARQLRAEHETARKARKVFEN
jgi:hypothetical protein